MEGSVFAEIGFCLIPVPSIHCSGQSTISSSVHSGSCDHLPLIYDQNTPLSQTCYLKSSSNHLIPKSDQNHISPQYHSITMKRGLEELRCFSKRKALNVAEQVFL